MRRRGKDKSGRGGEEMKESEGDQGDTRRLTQRDGGDMGSEKEEE